MRGKDNSLDWRRKPVAGKTPYSGHPAQGLDSMWSNRIVESTVNMGIGALRDYHDALQIGGEHHDGDCEPL